MPQSLTDILIVVAAVLLLWLVIRLFRKPIRWILKLLLNTAIGFAALFLLIQLADFGARLLPGGSAMGVRLGLLALILPFGYAVVLLTLGGWQQRYRLTAVCALAAAGMGVALAHPEGFSARKASPGSSASQR